MAHRHAASPKNHARGSQVLQLKEPQLVAVEHPWCRRLECSDNPDGSDLGRTVLSWEKGVEQSGFVWCNPLELLPAPWGRGRLAQDKLRTHTHTHTLGARRLLARHPAWLNRGTFTWGGIRHVPPMTAPGGTSARPGAGFRACTVALQHCRD